MVDFVLTAMGSLRYNAKNMKYGLIKGLTKGICRLARCNVHNGGFDYL